MDSLTQIVLGGAVGELLLGKKLGNKAILWGAIAGTIPDLDTIPGQFMGTVDRLSIHRGFSHSIIFAILLAPLLAWLVGKLYRKKEANWWEWTQLFFWGLFTHPLLDIFTTWGTQFFWPLEWRIALHSIFVIDPLYTLPFLLCLILLMFLKRKSRSRALLNRIGLMISSIYLLWSLGVKLYVNHQVEGFLDRNGIDYLSYQSRPTPLNTLLWTFNIEQEEAFLITYYSIFDEQVDLKFVSIPKQHELLKAYRNHPDIEELIFLTKDYYTIQEDENGLLMNDLRFGMVDGLDGKEGDFVFSYKIQKKGGELQIEQERRSFEGAGDYLTRLWERMLGRSSVLEARTKEFTK